MCSYIHRESENRTLNNYQEEEEDRFIFAKDNYTLFIIIFGKYKPIFNILFRNIPEE